MRELWTIQRALSIEQLGLGRGSIRLVRDPSMHAYIFSLDCEGTQEDLLTSLTRLSIEIEQMVRHVKHELGREAPK